MYVLLWVCSCGTSSSWVRKEHIRIAGDLNNRNILEYVVKLMLFATDTGSIKLVASAGSSLECAIGYKMSCQQNLFFKSDCDCD
jgi:hypothetical protein